MDIRSSKFSLELQKSEDETHVLRVIMYLYDLAFGLSLLSGISGEENDTRDTKYLTIQEVLAINAIAQHLKEVPFKSIRVLNRVTLSSLPEGMDTSELPNMRGIGSIHRHLTDGDAHASAVDNISGLGGLIRALTYHEYDDGTDSEEPDLTADDLQCDDCLSEGMSF